MKWYSLQLESCPDDVLSRIRNFLRQSFSQTKAAPGECPRAKSRALMLVTVTCGLAMGMFGSVCSVFLVLGALANFSSEATVLPAPRTSDDTAHSWRQQEPLEKKLLKSDLERTRRSSFLLRKCCGLGQVYHVSSRSSGNRNCLNFTASNHPSSTLVEVSQQLFFTSDDGTERYFTFEDFDIDDGLPRNCSGSNLMFLEPDTMLADRFYPIASGQLVVPHRFWTFALDHYCMEDLFLNDDFNKVKRVAIICLEHIQHFPKEATNHEGKLQLQFLEPIVSEGLTGLANRAVVRKCCDLNEVYLAANHTCISKQGYATQYFDDLISDTKFFLRVGLLSCTSQHQAAEFKLTANGALLVKLEETDDWSEDAVTVDNYCLDDFVVFLEDGLPETINLAWVCLDTWNQLSANRDNSTDLVVDEVVKVLQVPKCCSSAEIVEGNACQRLPSLEGREAKIESILLRSFYRLLQTSQNSSATLSANSSLSCGYLHGSPLNNGSWMAPLFRLSDEDKVSFSLNYYIRNYWDFDVTIEHFCLDLKHFRTLEEVYYEPYVFYCTSQSHVSGHYPVLLYISSTALLATFIVYFLIPATGAAKFVTSLGGRSKQKLRTRHSTMASMLTGRNLLCHVSSLAVAFLSLAIAQQEYASAGQESCTALGYVIYGASMASFSWLTVYCFDYCWMFRGSFKVSHAVLFIPYSIFGWGVPFLALLLACISQFYSESVGLPRSINPNMGLVRCWFAGETSALVFFYAPISFLLFLNVAFFMTLLFNPNLMNCWKRNGGPPLRVNRGRLGVAAKQNNDLKMVLKLFFITGIPWIFEIIAWLPSYVSNIPQVWRHHMYYLFEISNLLNSLRGVIVFFIFVVLQRDARRYLLVRFRKMFSHRDASVGPSGHPKVTAGSLSALSQRTLQSQLSTTSCSSEVSCPISQSSKDDDLPTRPHSETGDITYL